MIKIDKNEQFAYIDPNIAVIDSEIAQEIERKIDALYREGYYNYIIDFKITQEITDSIILLLKKINKICEKENGIMVIIAEDEEIIEELDQSKIEEIVIFPTKEEAIEAIYLHELENDFIEEEDEENNDEYGEENARDYE